MSIASWLRTLRVKRVPATEPSAAAARVNLGAIVAPETDQPPSDETVDNGVRMHIAASDPEFPAKREAAVEAILAAIDPVAQAHGFTRKAKSWAKEGPLGLVSLHVQRSRYGFESYINLGFQPKAGEGHGPWALDDFVRLGRFFPVETGAFNEPGALIYLDIHDDATALNEAMDVLDTRALPWLLAQLEDEEGYALPFLAGPQLSSG